MYDDLLVKHSALELRLTKAQEEHQDSINEHKVAKNKIKELEMDLYAERNAKKQLKRDLEVLKPRKSLKEEGRELRNLCIKLWMVTESVISKKFVTAQSQSVPSIDTLLTPHCFSLHMEVL